MAWKYLIILSKVLLEGRDNKYMTTDQAFDKMVQIVPLLGEILDDADASELKQEIKSENGQIPAGSVMQQMIPLFAGKHRQALYGIVAAVSDTSVDKVKEQPISVTLGTLRNALIDETMMFFFSCLRIVKNI